jgi:uncharacterized protein (TIGR02996 family)
VLADPNNDDPRRVYADWLAERGDPRGEFIAVQCELARKFNFHLVAREQQLRRENGVRWIAELGVTFSAVRCAYGSACRACQQVTFQRGFAERLDLRADELADLDVARVPLRSFVVCGVRDTNVRKLIGLRPIPTLDTFGLRNANLDAKAQRRLGDVELLATAPRLSFHGGKMSDASELAALALPALRSLHLDGVKIRNLEVLARAGWMAQLRSLTIRGNHKFGVDYLLGGCALPMLSELVIGSPVLASTVVALARLPELETLELPVGSSVLALTTGFAKLQRLVVRGQVADVALAALRERWGERLVVAI